MSNREIDALLAAAIGFEGCSNCGSMVDCGCEACDIGSGLPHYSTDPAASKQLRDKMNSDGWYARVETLPSGAAMAVFWLNGQIFTVREKSEFAAVALAALKAVGVQEEEK